MKDIIISLVLLLVVIVVCNSYQEIYSNGSSKRLTLDGLEDRVITFDVVPQPGL